MRVWDAGVEGIDVDVFGDGSVGEGSRDEASGDVGSGDEDAESDASEPVQPRKRKISNTNPFFDDMD